MDPIVIEGTPKTPVVNFNSNAGVLEIKGRSIPENAIEFYKPLIEWIESYGSGPKETTNVNIQLEYFNVT